MLAHLGGYVPHLEAMWAHLGAMLAHLRGYVGRSWGYVGPSWGLWVPMLTYLEPHVRCLCKNMLNVTGPKNTVNYRGFCRHAHPTGGRRQGPNYVGPSWGLCWPILRARWAQLGAMLTQLGAMLAYLEGYVGRSWGLCRPILRPMLAHVDPCGAKRSEKWEQQKNTVKRRIFWGSAAYLGAMWAYLGAMLAHLGAMLAHLGAMLAPLGAMLAHLEAYVGPSWGLCWPILRPMLAHPEAFVGPSWPILSHKGRKMRKNGKSTKHRKTRGFLMVRGGGGWVGGRGRGPSLLRRGEKRLRLCHGQGAPGRIYEAYAWHPGAGKSRPVSPSGRWCCCCCWPMLALFGRRFAPVLALGWPM